MASVETSEATLSIAENKLLSAPYARNHPSFGRLILYFVFSWLLSTVCMGATVVNVGVFIDGKQFSWITAIAGCVVVFLYNGAGAFVLGTLIGQRAGTRTTAIVYLVPALIYQAAVFALAAVSEQMKQDMLANSARHTIMPIVYLIVGAFTAFYLVRLGQNYADSVSRPNSILNVPWYHWLWALPFFLFQCIGVPLYLLLLLWKIDLLVGDYHGILSLPTIFPRMIVCAVLCGTLWAIVSTYETLSTDIDSKLVRILKVSGTWLLLTIMQTAILVSWFVPHMAAIKEKEQLHNQAQKYSQQGSYKEAEALYKRALVLAEKASGSNDPAVASELSNLAKVYGKEGNYSEAEPLYKRALAIDEKASGPYDLDVSSDLNHLAGLYCKQRRYAEAEPLYKRALAIDERPFDTFNVRFCSLFGMNVLKKQNAIIAADLHRLADLYRNEGNRAKAVDAESRANTILAGQK